MFVHVCLCVEWQCHEGQALPGETGMIEVKFVAVWFDYACG